MKRSPPPKRNTPLKRKRSIRPVNGRHRQARRERQFGPQSELARRSPCAACGSPPPSDPAHVRSRGAGGDDSQVIPLCRRCHIRQHARGWRALEAEHGFRVAEALEAIRDALGDDCGCRPGRPCGQEWCPGEEG